MELPTQPLSRFWSKVSRGPSFDCWEWQGGVSDSGYGVFWYRGCSVSAHRVAWAVSWGVDPGDSMVLHDCDNRRCCNPDHLFLGTHQDNMDDLVAKGRSARGERNNRARLTDAQVRAMRWAYGTGLVPATELGWWFGVSGVQSWNIVTNRQRKAA